MITIQDRETIEILRAFDECNEVLKEQAMEMVRIIHSGDAEPFELQAAVDTFNDIVFPDHLETSLDDWKGDEETEAELDQQEESFAESVRSIMEAKDINQTQLARAIGVGQPAISQLLNRDCRPQRSTVTKIAEALDVDESEIWND